MIWFLYGIGDEPTPLSGIDGVPRQETNFFATKLAFEPM
jgi:hypothetical protein